jgi:hypothetical protein
MSNRNSKLLLITLFLIAFTLRLTRILPNFEFVTTAMVISAAYLSRKHSALLILAIMITTDLILGNTNIFIFTWSGFLIPILLTSKSSFHRQSSIIKFLSFGIFSNLFFYMWTNFGVWALDSWNMYPKTMAGLISCYINGLPFLKTQLQSTIIFIPITLFALNAFKNHYLAKTLNIAK